MPEADTRELYPLSTPGGQPIPFEVFRPETLIRVAVTDVVSSAITIPTTVDFLILFCSIDCIIRLGATASVPASGVALDDAFFLAANTHLTVDHNYAANLRVIGVTAAATGNLFINAVKKWKDVQKPTIADRM